MRRVLLLAACALIVGTASASAGSLSLFGAYWDTDDLEETFGGGVGVGVPLGRVVDLDLRAHYLEQLTDDPVEALFEDDDPVFQKRSIQVLPLELGLRFNVAREGTVNPYVGGGVSYFFLDADRRELEVDDEVGFYALAGARFGDGEGADFFLEGLYRKVEARARRGDVGDLVESIPLDLDGPGVNLGVTWTW